MAKADLPYTYRNRKRLKTGIRDYWRFRRDGRDTPLPGSPNDPAFLSRYAELMAECDREKPDEPDRHTFEWLARAYLASAEFSALAEITQGDYRRTIDDRLLPALGPERFDCITRSAIKAVRDNAAKTHSARTAHKVKQMASRLYSWADEEELLPSGFVNPASGLRRLKGKSKSIEIWSPEEIALFLAGARGIEKTAVLLALYTGQRREDLVRLEWSDCLGDAIRVRQNKTGEPLTIPCHPVLRKHLKAIRTKFGGPVIRGEDGKRQTADGLSAAIRRAVTRIEGMPPRSLHGLRYAAAGALEEAGCSVVQISSIVGHRTYQMALKYARQRRDAEAAMARWEGRTERA